MCAGCQDLEGIKMPFNFPEPLRGAATENETLIWEALWRLVEALNVEEQIRAEKRETND